MFQSLGFVACLEFKRRRNNFNMPNGNDIPFNLFHGHVSFAYPSSKGTDYFRSCASLLNICYREINDGIEKPHEELS